MSFDISHILEDWDYQPGQVVVRRFVGKDGIEKIQLRVDLGLLQMNAQGRPDGKHPHGHLTMLDYYLHRRNQFARKHGGDADGFTLKADDCARLQLEALQYHHRCICLLQLEDYEGVIRDTTRNLKLFDFVKQHGESEELAWSLLQFRPQVLMMHTRAKASLKLKARDFSSAIVEVESGLEKLEEFYRDHARHDLAEQSLEIQSLRHWLEEIHQERPLSRREKLEMDLKEAVEREDYEKAARVRDALRKLKPSD
jgi:hypothetical protein